MNLQEEMLEEIEMVFADNQGILDKGSQLGAAKFCAEIAERYALDIAHEREVMITAFDKIRKEFEGRIWLTQGRGMYPYNDDRYKLEVKYLMDSFDAIQNEMWAKIKSKSFEYRDMVLKSSIDKVSPEDVEFWSWVLNEKFYPKPILGDTLWDKRGFSKEGVTIFTDKQLYQLFLNSKDNE